MHVPAGTLHRDDTPPRLAQPGGPNNICVPSRRGLETSSPRERPMVSKGKTLGPRRIDRNAWLAHRRNQIEGLLRELGAPFISPAGVGHRGGCDPTFRAVDADRPNARQKHSGHVRECRPAIAWIERTDKREPANRGRNLFAAAPLVEDMRVDSSLFFFFFFLFLHLHRFTPHPLPCTVACPVCG